MAGSSTASQDDPDPGPGPGLDFKGRDWDEPESPKSPESSAAAKKEKGRVRFNSTAATMKPPEIITTSPPPPPPPRPWPSVLRGNSSSSTLAPRDLEEHGLDPEYEKAISAVAAQERALQVAANVRRASPMSDSSRMSLDSDAETVLSETELMQGTIPLKNLAYLANGRRGSQQRHSEDDQRQGLDEEAYSLVQSHARRTSKQPESPLAKTETAAPQSRAELEEVNDGNYDGVYDVPPPQHYRSSVLSQLLKLYKPPEFAHHYRDGSSTGGHSTVSTPGALESGATTPTRRKWYDQNRSQDTLANLVEASARLANPNAVKEAKPGKWPRPLHKRAGSASRLSAFLQNEEVRITVHIAETLSRQEYIIKLCRALMLFGAPTHRLEEYLTMTARVLEIDGQFLYLPGCMVISFDDKSTHTTEVRIVRSAQGIDLGKLKDVHLIYKEVMHDVIGVEEGTQKLDVLMKARDKFHAWFRVLIFGLTSATAAPFSFKARLVDLPLTFFFGCLVGFLQLIVAPKSNLYSNVFEVSSTVLISFLARAFGSIRGGDLFCFSALAQGGIVMLLPGYMVLCSALELQSRAIVPGSIRIVYAIIYSLLLGFGITVGAALYGLFDNDATSVTSCPNPLPPYITFAFVPPFVICISIIYQAKWRQMPVMVIIAFAGYVVNYFSGIRFSASPQISSTLGALCVGVLANLYSRIRHGVAAATLIPAIFTQVPGGLASTGGLLSGLTMANQLTNSTQQVEGTGGVQIEQGESLDGVVFGVAAKMIQIATGIAVGLFVSALLIYPLGKRRSGLFSF